METITASIDCLACQTNIRLVREGETTNVKTGDTCELCGKPAIYVS
jgi:hypothetical protein